jgi:hypothetical protein
MESFEAFLISRHMLSLSSDKHALEWSSSAAGRGVELISLGDVNHGCDDWLKSIPMAISADQISGIKKAILQLFQLAMRLSL